MDRFIAHHLQGVSRTYAILVPMLPRRLAEPVGLAYLLMRVVDTLEDCTTLTDDERLARFDALRTLLADHAAPVPPVLAAPLGDTPAELDLMRELPGLLDRLRALPPAHRDAIYDCAREMMDGVIQMMDRARQRGLPYPAVCDAAELRMYCYYVAGVVGVMLNRMMADYLRMPALLQLRDLSIELGIGLQLVNVLKDALTAARHGRRYLPVTSAGELSAAESYKPALREARTRLQRGIEFVLALPATARELRYFCGLPIAWGAMTLARAESDASAAKIGRSSIAASIDRIKALAGDDHALRRWLAGLLDTPTPATSHPS